MNNNLLNNALNISKLLITEILSPGDIVIDATLGNGHDTLFMASLVGQEGHVYAFDIQDEAIQSAREKIETSDFDNITLIKDSHENIRNHVKQSVKLIVFNLGFLPGGDPAITTQTESTLKAIQEGLKIINENGVIMLVVYRGHSEGLKEWPALLDSVSELDQSIYNVAVTDFPNQKNNPPALISIQRRR